MGEKEILAATYHDRLTVFRRVTYIDENTGESRERESTIYESVPCALSQSKNEVPTRGETTFRKSEEYALFTTPDIRMEADDKAEVVTEAGELYFGRTGRTLVYADSHGETKMQVEGIA